MANPAEIVAEAAEAHRLTGAMYCACLCGFSSSTGAARTFYEQYADHVAAAVLDALAANGYALVELPKPEKAWHGEETLWPAPMSHSSHPGQIEIRKSDGLIGMTSVPSIFDTPEDALAVAASLVAAARAVSLPIETPTEEKQK